MIVRWMLTLGVVIAVMSMFKSAAGYSDFELQLGTPQCGKHSTLLYRTSYPLPLPATIYQDSLVRGVCNFTKCYTAKGFSIPVRKWNELYFNILAFDPKVDNGRYKVKQGDGVVSNVIVIDHCDRIGELRISSSLPRIGERMTLMYKTYYDLRGNISYIKDNVVQGTCIHLGSPEAKCFSDHGYRFLIFTLRRTFLVIVAFDPKKDRGDWKVKEGSLYTYKQVINRYIHNNPPGRAKFAEQPAAARKLDLEDIKPVSEVYANPYVASSIAVTVGIVGMCLIVVLVLIYRSKTGQLFRSTHNLVNLRKEGHPQGIENPIVVS